MDQKRLQSTGVWTLAKGQQSVVARRQLLELGFSSDAIHHRRTNGRLHPIRPAEGAPPWRGVYAVGRPKLTRYGIWMAAVLVCGPDAALSHTSAAQLWEIRVASVDLLPVEVSVPPGRFRRHPGIVIHRRSLPPDHVTAHRQIPVTTPTRTLIDLATQLGTSELEAAVNEASSRDLIDLDELRTALDEHRGAPGVAILRAVIDRRTFRLTDSELERQFLRLVKQAGLPLALTQQWVNGVRVDFYWPDLGLVVETDGLRYHRTPARQARDQLRDQRHLASGLTPLRFSHAQVRYEPGHVRATLVRVVRRLRKL